MEEQKEIKEKKPYRPEIKDDGIRLVRILSKDIPNNLSVYAGLTRIKGISWAFSNAVCSKMGITRKKKIEELTKDEIVKLSEIVKKPSFPKFLLNRRKDYDTGNDFHLHGSDLDLRREFDIKRLKKIKSYKGVRHTHGQPVRGQRTKSHFRTNRKKTGAVGVTKAKPTKAAAAATPEKKK